MGGGEEARAVVGSPLAALDRTVRDGVERIVTKGREAMSSLRAPVHGPREEAATDWLADTGARTNLAGTKYRGSRQAYFL